MNNNAGIRLVKCCSIVGILTVIILFNQSCYYDVEEVIYPSITCDTAMISYANDIVPIIQDNCIGCHSQAAGFGNVVLEGYNSIKTFADNGKLLGSVRHDPGFSPMPQNQAQLLECEIAKIEKWILDGAPNN